MNKNRNMEQTSETLRDYHRKALSFLRENLNPVLAQHFTKMKENSALMVLESSTPTYIRNIQAILNLMLLAERASTAYASDNDNVLDQIFTLTEYYDIANETFLTLNRFDLKASPETLHLITLLRNHDRISFDALTNTLPELAKLTKEIKGASSTAIDKLGDVVSDLNLALKKSQENDPSNKQVLEGVVAVSAPNLAEKFELKDSDERYVINPQADGEVVTSVKRIANSLDYLNEALNFKLNAEKGQFFGGLVEGVLKYKEVIGAICSLSPAILNTSEDIKTKLRAKAKKLIPVIREAMLNAVKMEIELGLRPGYLADQILPFATRYIEFAKTIGMKLSIDEKRLFLSERQALRKKTLDDAAAALEKTRQLKQKVDQVEVLLNTTTPLSNFDAVDLATLTHAIPLLQLPKDLETQFKKEINEAFEGLSVIGIGIDYLRNMAGHRISVQNQIWDHVYKNFADIEAHENTLESQITALNFGRVHELLNEKPTYELTKEETEFLLEHIDYYVSTSKITDKHALHGFDQIKKQLQDLNKYHAIGDNNQATEDNTPSSVDLVALNKDINSRNIKMADVAKEFRQFILGNIRAYFAESIVQSFDSANDNGIFEIYSDDPKHIQDMKNLLSALTVLEKTFRAAEGSYFSGLMQATKLKEIASQFHLNYQQQMELANLFFGKVSTRATTLGNELTSDVKFGLYLKDHADSSKAQPTNSNGNPQSFIGFFHSALSLSEWAYSYIDFSKASGSANVDLKPYVEQMIYIKKLTEEFIQDYFKEGFAERFTPNAMGLYNLGETDSAIVRDAKTMLNSLHHMTISTDDVNNYLQRSYFDLPTAVNSISTFVTSLNELDLTSTHAQLSGLRAQLIKTAQRYVDDKINPLLIDLMKQGDRYEQAIGLHQGVLTNHLQSVVDIYQAQHENLGIETTTDTDNAFLDMRNEERNQFLEESKAELAELEKNQKEIEQQLSKQLPILSKWYNVLTGANTSLSRLNLLKSVQRNIDLLGDEKTIEEFSSIVETLIQNYSNLEAGHNREVKLYDTLRAQINVRYIYQQKKLANAQKAIDDFNATKGYRMAVIQDHQNTLIENAQKAQDAVIKAAEAKEKAEEAQHVIAQISLDDTEQPSVETLAIVKNAKRLSKEAHELAAEADQLAAESHLGIAKREVSEVKAEVRETERNLERAVTPPIAPEEIEQGFFAQLFISALKFIADLFDTFVLAIKTLFTFTDSSSSKISKTKPVKRKSEIELERTDSNPSLIIYTGDESELEDTESAAIDQYSSKRVKSVPNAPGIIVAGDESQSKRVQATENSSLSYAAARERGFHASKLTTTDTLNTPAQDQNNDPTPPKNHYGK
ncbi:MAG: hypothetical protein K2X50_01515 [Gammaproteobacteria bacterium]|nr:hypothetical protein [Gammaproteobacteria bacterium]